MQGRVLWWPMLGTEGSAHSLWLERGGGLMVHSLAPAALGLSLSNT